jgi:hypothetical protein
VLVNTRINACRRAFNVKIDLNRIEIFISLLTYSLIALASSLDVFAPPKRNALRIVRRIVLSDSSSARKPGKTAIWMVLHENHPSDTGSTYGRILGMLVWNPELLVRAARVLLIFQWPWASLRCCNLLRVALGNYTF